MVRLEEAQGVQEIGAYRKGDGERGLTKKDTSEKKNNSAEMCCNRQSSDRTGDMGVTVRHKHRQNGRYGSDAETQAQTEREIWE